MEERTCQNVGFKSIINWVLAGKMGQFTKHIATYFMKETKYYKNIQINNRTIKNEKTYILSSHFWGTLSHQPINIGDWLKKYYTHWQKRKQDQSECLH